jgi:flavin reductase (DIM6/NTAB) family NADH-FMN oxidoreductase RutF
MTGLFDGLSRQQFRTYFQPSRIVLCVLPCTSTESGVTVTTLCFDMYCSYKPPMMAIAVHNINESHRHIQAADEWVLAVPGESMVIETMHCGTVSSRNADKVKDLSLELEPSKAVGVPGLARAIANIEIKKVTCVPTGDHVIAVGTVVRFAVHRGSKELPLLSVGSRTAGFRVLAKSGIHRIGVVDTVARRTME